MAEEDPKTTDDQTTDDDWRGEYAEKLDWAKTPQDLAKSYLELQTKASKMVSIPDPNDPEKMAKFYSKMGRPETPDKYTIPEDKAEGIPLDEGTMATVRDAAHRAGLNTNQWDGVMGAYLTGIQEMMAKNEQEVEKLNTERWEKLQTEWGADKTTENIELAKRVVRESPELEGIMSEEDVAKDPVFVSVMSRLMRAAGDDKLIRGDDGEPDADYEPKYPGSPEMYRFDDSPEGEKARNWFIKRGHKY